MGESNRGSHGLSTVGDSYEEDSFLYCSSPVMRNQINLNCIRKFKI